MASITIGQASRGTLVRAAFAQFAGLGVALWLAAMTQPYHATWLPWLLVAAQAFSAAVIARSIGMAPWWVGLHLAFAPGLAIALAFGIPPVVPASGFLALLALFGLRTMTDQVPVYLSSRRALHALMRVLPASRFSMIDIGAGTGRALRAVRRHRPQALLEGIESAPLPWLISLVSSWRVGYRVRFGDFWLRDLSGQDVVYAYLSPVAMPRLWQKARAEMRSGGLLVSNSFAVPGQAPDDVIRYGREAGAVLYVWRMK